MERRRQGRTRKRIPCRIEIKGARYSAIVLDVSERGLFVQTKARPDIGSTVEVELGMPGSDERLRVEARVARRRQVPRQLTAIASGGVGLRVDRPSVDFLAFVREIQSQLPGGARSAARRA